MLHRIWNELDGWWREIKELLLLGGEVLSSIWMVVVLIGIVVAAVTVWWPDITSYIELRKDLADLQCGDVVPEIIALSQEQDNSNPLTPRILKMYDVQEVGRSDERLDCMGLARTSTGQGLIVFHMEEDRDGDKFIGYSRSP